MRLLIIIDVGPDDGKVRVSRVAAQPEESRKGVG